MISIPSPFNVCFLLSRNQVVEEKYGQEITSNIIFGVIALLGTEFSRRKKDVGITAMTTISIAGIIAYPGIFDIGYIIVLVAVLLFFFGGNKKSSE